MKICLFNLSITFCNEQRYVVAYLDSVQARLASLRELQSATGEELSALLPSVLDRLQLQNSWMSFASQRITNRERKIS